MHESTGHTAVSAAQGRQFQLEPLSIVGNIGPIMLKATIASKLSLGYCCTNVRSAAVNLPTAHFYRHHLASSGSDAVLRIIDEQDSGRNHLIFSK